MTHRLVALIVLVLLTGFSRLEAQPRLAAIQADKTPATLEVGASYTVAVTVRNTGSVPWRIQDAIFLSYHWADSSGRVVVQEGLRTPFPGDVDPGQEATVCARVQTPGEPGSYQLQWDMVKEGVAWLSAVDPPSLAVRGVTVVEVQARATPGAIATIALVAAVFLLHGVLTAAWAWRRCRGRMDTEIVAFLTVVIWLGSTQAVLHTLLFTVGLSIVGSVLAICAVQAALWASHRPWAHFHEVASSTQTPALPVRRVTNALATLGAAVLLGLVLQWAAAATASSDVAGTDAAHYHFPHAVNFARGVSPLDFLATPHRYPMGSSVWVAWLIQAGGGAVIADLATLPAFILLCASSIVLLHLLGATPGCAWAPWLLLIVFSSWLVRLCVHVSADLLYAAAFLALVATLLISWDSRRLDGLIGVAAALNAGMLVSAKTPGAVSLVFVVGAWTTAMLVRRWRGTPLSGTLRLPGAAVWVVAFVAAGGIWLMRNWWLFGSPIAPAGVRLWGWTVFKGDPYEATRLYLSVAGDIARDPSYAPWRRFAHETVRLMGAWYPWLACAGVALAADVFVAWRQRSWSDTLAVRRILVLLLAAWAFGSHAYLLAGAPWTSLEWTNGLSIRYLLPFLVLWPIFWYAVLFCEAWPWHRRLAPCLGGGAFLAATTIGIYGAHQAMPGFPAEVRYFALDARWLAASLACVGLLSHPARRLLGRSATVLVAVGAVVAVLVFAASAAGTQVGTDARDRGDFGTQDTCASLSGSPDSNHRSIYRQVVHYQLTRGQACGSTRFFVLSWFDWPLALQDGALSNVVLAVDRRGFDAALLRLGPRRGSCDVVIVSEGDAVAQGEPDMAARLHADGTLALVGQSGGYRAYVVR